MLAEHRKTGTAFEDAWVSALRSLPKGSNYSSQQQIKEWKAILRWAKPHYRSAYEIGHPLVVVDELQPLAA